MTHSHSSLIEKDCRENSTTHSLKRIAEETPKQLECMYSNFSVSPSKSTTYTAIISAVIIL
jgi:hypothetical protein